jgi:hypothetical protein
MHNVIDKFVFFALCSSHFISALACINLYYCNMFYFYMLYSLHTNKKL